MGRPAPPRALRAPAALFSLVLAVSNWSLCRMQQQRVVLWGRMQPAAGLGVEVLGGGEEAAPHPPGWQGRRLAGSTASLCGCRGPFVSSLHFYLQLT